MNHLRILAVTCLALLVAPAAHAQRKADSLAIHAILQEEVTSWNRGDAATYSRHFAENGTFTNIRGMFFTGHQQFLDRHREIFQGMFSKTVLQQAVVSFRFLSPEVAIVETLTWITGFAKQGAPKGVYLDAHGRLHTRLLQVFQKQAGEWKIVVYHNVDVKPDTPVPAHP
ncbi:YybH family protein [Hymenobacter sp. BT491]|uniref:YybH family protein n=1 Tax=Hymenobacter sp. BT491 TaxID=2766779 RepID=UPI0016534794|nr:SgcJ/EcaC family oxidoreductase [Hymenobacter sp. BT491]MBC6992332.1 SgcJ/EcaC family oxidoreductase [Hymenobacter sp. BT491]